MNGIKNSDYNLLDSLFGGDGLTYGVYLGDFEENVDASLQVPKINSIKEGEMFDVVISPLLKNMDNFNRQGFYYFNNPDGTMRWIYPIETKRPNFLAFYNSNYYKAKLIKFGFHMAFLTGQSKRISTGKFYVYAKEKTRLETILGPNVKKAFSLFTGTVGSSRKFVIETHEGKKIQQFIKLGVTDAASKYILREYNHLEELKGLDSTHVIIPSVKLLDSNGVIALSNVKPKKNYATKDFTRKHALALKALHQTSLSQKKIEELSIMSKVQINLTKLNAFSHKHKLEYAAEMIEDLNHLNDQLELQKVIKVSLAHNDFTPWNAYVGKQQLHIYDWEMAIKDAPILFDLFHYIFQSNVLLKHQGYDNIRKEIEAAIGLPEIQSILEEEADNWAFYLKLYLLDNVSYYLNRYLNQDQLHMQAAWLLKVWYDALRSLKNNN